MRFAGWHERGYLPHRDESGLTQFVTFQLEDACPAELRAQWHKTLAGEKDAKQRQWLESCLEQGRGKCLLKHPELASTVDAALRFHNGHRYELRAWVVMPNHVHVLLVLRDMPLGRVVGHWKRYTSRKAAKIIGNSVSGGIWAADYWDTYMRDAEHERRVVRYIENNPTKAHLVLDPCQWDWGSARFRGDDGVLRVKKD
ncbi:MAG: transposase [Verrucomicrobiales bacterium]|nr:transposase [Verrucomicrobiales bacterium]